MRASATVHSPRLAGERPYHVEVVYGMVEDFQTRCALEKCPEAPRLLYDEADLDVDAFSELPCVDQLVQRDDLLHELQLKVHGRHKAEFAADLHDRTPGREIFAHRLLYEHSRASR